MPPLDHAELIAAGVPPSDVGTLKGRYPLTFTRTSFPPGDIYRPALSYFELYATTRPAIINELSGTTKRSSFRYRMGYVAFNTPASRWHAQWESRIEGFSLYIQPDIMDDVVEETFGEAAESVSWRALLGDYVPAIAYLTLDIGSQATAGYPAGVGIVEGQVKTLLTMLARRYSRSPGRETGLVGIHSAAVLRAVQFINHNLCQSINVAQIADAAAASPSHLNRLFRGELGVSVWTYVQHQRLEAIKIDLSTTDTPVHEIAAAFGIKSAPTFNRFFKSNTGVTPSMFRAASQQSHGCEENTI